MRLARLAAVGLAIGLIAGFAVALLRSRPHAPAGEVVPVPDEPERHLVPAGGGEATVLELRRRARG